MSWVSVIALAPAVFLVSSANYRTVLQFIVCWTAAMIVIQSFRAEKYGWVATFCAIALLFNPIVPVAIPRPVFGWLTVGTLGLFVASLFYVRTMPQPAMISIASPPTGGEMV
ncbi:MAG TPA: DUF6804 family protein [Terriglobales bacterium]|nr:DUF6804 family protein [Terriglobales bacterium]